MTEKMTQDQFRRVMGQVNRITIDLPLPPADLHPNGRTHWAKKAKLTKDARTLAYLTARSSAPKQPLARACYSLEFWLPRKRDYDGLGAWVKAFLDGCQDARIVANDSELRPAGIVRHSGLKQTKGKSGVRITIWEESEARDE